MRRRLAPCQSQLRLPSYLIGYHHAPAPVPHPQSRTRPMPPRTHAAGLDLHADSDASRAETSVRKPRLQRQCLSFELPRLSEERTSYRRWSSQTHCYGEPVRRVRTMVCCMTRGPIRAETAGSAPGAVVFSLPDACSQAVLPTQPVPPLQEHFQRLQQQGTARPIGIRAILCAVVR